MSARTSQQSTLKPALPNIAVKRDWLTAGFAAFQPAPHLYVMQQNIYR